MKFAGTRPKENRTIKNQQLIKETNLKNIFDLIYESGEISRAKLVEITGLSPTTVSALVEELLNSGIVRTKGIGESKTSGRKPILLEVDRECAQIATISWQPSGLCYSLLDLLCNEVEDFFLPVNDTTDYADAMYSLLNEKSSRIDLHKTLALCISIPAIIDARNMRIISTVINISENDDVLERINNSFPELPVMIGNESAFYAYAESAYSSLQNTRNLVYINIGMGVGAGIIQGGGIYRGAHGMAGEFGHMSMDLNGAQCSCGNRGCLERLIKTPRIIELITEQVSQGKSSVIRDLCEGDYSKMDIPMISEAYNSGDPLVNDVIADVAKTLSIGLSSIISFYDPEHIIIGGGIERLGKRFLNEIKDQTILSGFRKIVSNVDIRFTELPSFNYRNKGAARYYIDNIFRISGNSRDELIIC